MSKKAKKADLKAKACTGKVRHPRRLCAIMALKHMKNAQLTAYKCSFCGGWHTGHNRGSWLINARIDQLIGKPEGDGGKGIKRGEPADLSNTKIA